MNRKIMCLIIFLFLLQSSSVQAMFNLIFPADVSAFTSYFGNDNTQHAVQTNITSSPCSCALFLTSQFIKDRPKSQFENPIIVLDFDEQFSCSADGMKDCKITCAEKLAPYLASSEIICAFAVDRDVFGEQIFLFVKSCHNEWVKTVLTDRKKYCCKDGEYYKCPKL